MRTAFTFSLALVLGYGFLQKRKVAIIAWPLMVVALAGIYFVQKPEHANVVAHLVGIGRGADLILYCWVIISLFFTMNLFFRLENARRDLTKLAREFAIHTAVPARRSVAAESPDLEMQLPGAD